MYSFTQYFRVEEPSIICITRKKQHFILSPCLKLLCQFKTILISVVLSLGVELLQTSSFLHCTKKILESENQDYSPGRSQTDQDSKSLKGLRAANHLLCLLSFTSMCQMISRPQLGYDKEF